MAKVAAIGSLSSNSLHYGNDCLKVATKAKRKTPSELRGEQLKRRHNVEILDESPAPSSGSLTRDHGLRKLESLKNPKYVDARMDKIFPVKKPTSRLGAHSGKGGAKEGIALSKQIDSLKNHSKLAANSGSETSVPSASEFRVGSGHAFQTAENFSQNEIKTVEKDKSSRKISEKSAVFSCSPAADFESGVASATVPRDSFAEVGRTTDRCNSSTFRTVAELSLGNEKSYDLENIDMDKALKGLNVGPPTASASERFSGSTRSHIHNLSSELHIPGSKIPLDFTLKSTMWVLTSSSVNWFHRLITCGASSGLAQISSQISCSGDQSLSQTPGITSTNQVLKSMSLHSWVYPQSTLPASIVSALTLSASGGAEIDFLSKRRSLWEESFRSLYFMLRKNICSVFYVCTSQFIVMFTTSHDLGSSKRSCNAYVSQSTRNLRSLLQEHDIEYSMPLCHSKVEQATREDLVELSEIEKHNLGQTRHGAFLHDIDNSPESLLVFNGNERVHGLFDFLLNYRYLITSLTGMDVPALYSPILFQNAALCTPEVRCKEMKRAEHIALRPKGSSSESNNSNKESSLGLSYSIEIKGAYLPPWIISNACAAMTSVGKDFEASFLTEPSSLGLNVALETGSEESDPETGGNDRIERSNDFGIQNTVLSPTLRPAFLKSLKYCDGSYMASLSHV